MDFMQGKKNKAVTFSFDDGVLQDIRLIEILNKYNLKGTFNLNSGRMGDRFQFTVDGTMVNHQRNRREDIKYIYEGHEVAVHTLTHADLTKLDDEEVWKQVEQDRLTLSDIVGYDVAGMAYPCGYCDERVVHIIKEQTRVSYARTVGVTYSFEPCADLYRYEGTLFAHRDFDKLFDFGKQLIEMKTDSPQVLYIWGHAYEFDIYPERWRQFEEFCEMISNKSDIFYGTNREVLM